MGRSTTAIQKLTRQAIQLTDILPFGPSSGTGSRGITFEDFGKALEKGNYIIQDAGNQINDETDLYVSSQTETLLMPATRIREFSVNAAVATVVTLQDNNGNTFKSTGTDTATVNPGTKRIAKYGSVWLDDL